ncbi:MAG: JAB domain-containing protein, partial [Lactococcus raffinolactis]
SDADVVFTERMENACDYIGVNLVDHIIVGQQRYFSFQESGLIF